MTCEAQAKNTMLMVKCTEPCLALGAGSTVPPLGNLNGTMTEHASHRDNREIGSSGNLYSEAYMGAFWIVPGRTDLSFSPDYDKGEISSLDSPKRYFRGQGSYTGTLGVNKEPGIPRWEAAIHGEWLADQLRIGEGNKFILYEFWTFENPDRKDYGVTQAELLTKHYGVVLDTADKTFEDTFKFSIPLSIIYKEEFPFWENGKVGSYDGDQWDVEILETAVSGNLNVGTWNEAGDTSYLPVTFNAVGDAGTLSFGDNDSDGLGTEKSLSMHTRLALQIDDTVGADLTVKIAGMTVYGVWMEETIDLTKPGAGLTYEVITQTYFYDEFYITLVSGTAADTVRIAPVDHVVRTPYSGFPFMS